MTVVITERPLTKTLAAALTTLLPLFASAVFAADRPIFESKGVAIRGADAVAYFSLEEGAKAVYGSEDISFEYMGATWHFASEENRDRFAADPQRYTPQYGGYCAFAVARGSTASIDPDAWHIKDGKLYLNLSKRIRRKWLKDRDAEIARANANWPTVLAACEAKGKCKP